MKKKISGSTSKIEDRLLGFETRLTRIESKLTDNGFDVIRLTNRVTGVEKSITRLDDSVEKLHDQIHDEFAEFRSKIITLIDPLIGQLKKFNEEQAIHAGQHQETYEKVEKLEKIHPKFSHAAI